MRDGYWIGLNVQKTAVGFAVAMGANLLGFNTLNKRKQLESY